MFFNLAHWPHDQSPTMSLSKEHNVNTEWADHWPLFCTKNYNKCLEKEMKGITQKSWVPTSKKANNVNFNPSNLWSYPVRMKVVGKERWTKSSNVVKHLGNTHTHTHVHTHRLTSTHLCAQLGSPHHHLLIPYCFQVHPSHTHLITQHTYIVSIQTSTLKHNTAGVCACLCVCVLLN